MNPKNVPNHVIDNPSPSIKEDVWLMQRLEKPTGYVNPWGDVNHEIKDKSIADVISPDYMGAAEYEWGVYNKCLDTMYKWGAWSRMIHIYPTYKSIPVNIVSTHGCEEAEIEEQVRYLYLEVSRVKHETGSYPEISKSDLGSFYRDCQDFMNAKYIGWLNVKKFYAIFLNGDHAKDFMDHINDVHKKVAYNLDKETV